MELTFEKNIYKNIHITLLGKNIKLMTLKDELENSTNLKSFSILKTMKKIKFSSLMKSVALNKSLKKLYIVDYQEITINILRELSKHPKLKKLSIRCQIGTEILKELCNLISNGWKLSSLLLWNNDKVLLECGDIFAEMLKNNTTLKRITIPMSLENCRKWIPYNKTLKRILLTNENFSFYGLKNNEDLLFKNNTLKYFSLDDNIKKNSSIISKLKDHPSIKYLKLNYPEFDNDSIDLISSMKLKGLILWIVQATEIEKILEKNTQLEYFKCNYYFFATTSNQIEKSILYHPNLKKLLLCSWRSELAPLFAFKKQWKEIKFNLSRFDKLELKDLKNQFHLKKFIGEHTNEKHEKQLEIDSFCKLNKNWQKSMNQANLNMIIKRYYIFIGKDHSKVPSSSTLTSKSLTCFLIWILNRIFPIDMVKLIILNHWWLKDLEEKSFMWKHIKDESLSWYYDLF